MSDAYVVGYADIVTRNITNKNLNKEKEIK